MTGVGATTVTLTAADASSNIATTTFTVNTVDVTNPVAVAPANMAVSNDIGSCGAIVNFSVSATDNCSGATAIASPVSGSFFPIGTTTVLVVANDGSNNQGFATFDVVVTDTELPMIMGTPSNTTVSNDVGSCGAVVTWAAPTVMDNCAGATVSTSMASGSNFPIGTTTVTVNAMDANGNPATSSFTVTVNDAEMPVLTVPAPQTVNLDNMCQATVPDLVAMSSATDNCAGTVITQSPLAGSPIVGSSPVTITITATDASMNAASSTVVVTPNVMAASITPSGPTTFCDDGNVWLFAPVNASYTYQWYNSGTAIPGATVDSAMMTASGSYWVEVTVPGACTMVSPPISVTELAEPAAPSNITITAPVGATNPVTICDGTNVSLMYSGASPASQYLWAVNGTNVNYSLNPSSSFASNAFLAGSNNVELRVVYTADPFYCLSAPASVTVIKNIAPATTISAAGPTTFCANTPTTLNATPNTAGLTFVWRRSNIVIPSATTASYVPIQSGNHNVTITDANGCSKTSGWLNVTLLPVPVANAGIDRNLCVGSTVQIGSSTNGANSYTWSPTTALSNPFISNPITSATTTTAYTVTVTNTSTGCANEDVMVVTSLAQPATPSLAISGMPGASSATVCQGTNVVLVPTSVGTANVWAKNGTTAYTYLPAQALTLSAANPVADVWTIRARDVNNCLSMPSNAISVLINANPIPTITPLGTNGIVDVCLNGQPTATQVLTANTPVGSPSATFTWQQLVSGNYTTVGTGPTYTATVGSAVGQTQKSYRVMATYTNACVRNSSTKTVKVLAGCKGDGSKDGDEIIEITTDSDVVVAYPNPTSGMLNVDIENSEATEGKLVLYNALGQIVVERVVMLEGGKASEILDLTNVAIGVYTLSFQTENGQKTQKVVKE